MKISFRAHLKSSLPILSLTALSFLIFALFWQHYIGSLLDRVEAQYRQGIVDIASVARNSIEPILKKVRAGEIGREDARREIRQLVRSMTYLDQDGRNYVFMSTYDGTMLVQPYEPDKEMTNQWDLKDARGLYIIRELVRAARAHPKGSFVTYHYYLPGVHQEQEKLAYVIGLPEIQSYIGTGKYMARAIQENEWILTKAKNAYIILLVISLFPAFAAIRSLHVRNRRLVSEIEIRKKAEEKFAKLYMMTPDCIAISRVADGKLLDVNRAFEEVAGWKRDEVVGRTSLDIGFWIDPSIREFLVNELKKGNDVIQKEFQFRTKDQSIRTGIYSARTISISGEWCIIFVLQDITQNLKLREERQKLEMQLIQSQKMDAIGKLAGGVAHDFNNMLSIILGNAEIAMASIQRNNPLYTSLEEIHNAGTRSADLTRQLLAFARKQTVNPQVLDLNDTISGMLKMLRRLIGEDIDMNWIPGRDLWKVRIDPSQIDQLLANLTVNARDAIDKQGKITIESANVKCDEAFGHGLPDFVPGDYVMLAVSDDGCGIEKAMLPHVFDPFYTTKEEGRGTGLGLSTVYGIAKQNGGFTRVYSEPGKGATFRVYLPCCAGQETEASTGRKVPALPRGTETILLVEDEDSVLNLAANMLRKLGYKVLSTGKADEAIRFVSESGDAIALLLIDVVMPGMNGKELSETIRAIRPGLKCLYMSGYTADVIARQGILEEGLHFMSKPFSMRDLAAKVRESIDS